MLCRSPNQMPLKHIPQIPPPTTARKKRRCCKTKHHTTGIDHLLSQLLVFEISRLALLSHAAFARNPDSHSFPPSRRTSCPVDVWSIRVCVCVCVCGVARGAWRVVAVSPFVVFLWRRAKGEFFGRVRGVDKKNRERDKPCGFLTWDRWRRCPSWTSPRGPSWCAPAAWRCPRGRCGRP